jgi:hypothetical protein
MKIISKYKDYYDYLQGVRGIDEKIVLDRSEGKSLKEEFPKDGDRHVFIICGERYEIYYFQTKYYTEEQLLTMGKMAVRKSGSAFGFEIIDIPSESKTKKRYSRYGKYWDLKWNNPFRKPEDFTYIKCPIVKFYGRDSYDFVEFPKLEDFNFGSIISAEEIWNKVYNWASQVPDHENNQTNSDKIVSHGFDLKESFRPKMK